jgi:hypothetical protein
MSRIFKRTEQRQAERIEARRRQHASIGKQKRIAEKDCLRMVDQRSASKDFTDPDFDGAPRGVMSTPPKEDIWYKKKPGNRNFRG